MKRLLTILALLLFIPTLSRGADTAPPAPPTTPPPAPSPRPAFTIGVIDILKIGAESRIGKEEKKRFEARGEKLKGEIEARGKKLEKEKKALEEKFPSLTPEQRQKQAKEFDKKVEAYRKMVQKAQSEMEPLQKEINDRIFSLVEKGAAQVGAARGLSLVIPKREVLYQSSDTTVVDVTDDVLKAVDELYAAK